MSTARDEIIEMEKSSKAKITHKKKRDGYTQKENRNNASGQWPVVRLDFIRLDFISVD